nr:hypothetical protein [Planctomycetota bacterium]
MPRPRRTPLQTMAIAFALAIGLIVGVRMIGRLYAPKAAERAVAGRPDLEVIDAMPAQLAAAGWRLDERSPRSWTDISVRLFENDRGNLTLLRCRVDAAEALGLAAFPPDSRRPSEDRAPADWPWGADGDPFRVPAWWSPAGAQSRLYESFPPDGLRRGVFANYDPASRWLHLWSWARNDVRPVRADALAHLVVDELATVLSAAALAEQWPADADGWFTRD